ncbi:MAG: laminin G domain-containing protein, partial [Clostridia bacterium]|nr:laminin G domain-containing protein [Clostridia bacterium]
MKAATKKILALALALLMVLPCVLALSVSAQNTALADDTDTGVSFTSTKTFTLPSSVNSAPLTMEAVLRVPKGTGRAGVILGNYTDNVNTVCFEIHENGQPRLYAKQGSTLIDIKLNTDIRSDDYIHLAIVIDTVNTKVVCYVNGIEKASATDTNLADFASYTPKYQYQIGGDCRGGNAQYFKGTIKNVAIYSDARTKDEIVSDASSNMNGLSTVDKNQLVAAYDITKPMPECVKDLSGNGHKLKFYSPEFEQQMMEEGMTFKSTDTYKVYSPFAEKDYPVTLEATMFVQKDKTGRTGVVMGNYSSGKWSMTFELINGGQPRIYFETLGGKNQTDLIFNNVDVRTGYWAHVAIVIDIANGNASCYLDGEEMQTLPI